MVMLGYYSLLYLSILVRTLQTMPGKKQVDIQPEQRESKTEKIIEEQAGIGLGFILGMIFLLFFFL